MYTSHDTGFRSYLKAIHAMLSTAYIATKPLQILMVLSIIHQHKGDTPIRIIIIDSFADARATCERLAAEFFKNRSIKFDFCKTYKNAYKLISHHRMNTIYIDSDVGLTKYASLLLLKARLPRLNIYVYEEGIGTYRTDLYSGIKRNLLKYIGAGIHFGGSLVTSGIYVLETERYKSIFRKYKKPVHKIHLDPTNLLKSNEINFNYIFAYEGINPKNDHPTTCNLYLSSWKVDYNFIIDFIKLPGDNYIKLHPHLRSDIKLAHANYINCSAPAELVIIDLINTYEIINVYHHGSSVVKYIKNKNLNFILLRNNEA